MMMQKRTNTGSCFNMKLPIFVHYTMLDIAQLCKTKCHSRNYFRLIEQHGHTKSANIHEFKLHLAYFQCQREL